MPFVQANATVVTIFAGVNEINMITAALGGGEGGSDPNAFIDAQVQRVRQRLPDADRRHPHQRPAIPRIVILNVPTRPGCPFSPARRSRSARRRSAPPSA